jgi:hypothetical protein
VENIPTTLQKDWRKLLNINNNSIKACPFCQQMPRIRNPLETWNIYINIVPQMSYKEPGFTATKELNMSSITYTIVLLLMSMVVNYTKKFVTLIYRNI